MLNKVETRCAHLLESTASIRTAQLIDWQVKLNVFVRNPPGQTRSLLGPCSKHAEWED